MHTYDHEGKTYCLACNHEIGVPCACDDVVTRNICGNCERKWPIDGMDGDTCNRPCEEDQ